MKVREIMTLKPISVGRQTPVTEVAKVLVSHDITGVPVVDDDGRVVGVITEVDLIVRHANIRFPRYIKFLESVIYLESTEEYDEEVRRFLGSVAYEVMSSPAVTVGPEMDVADLAELMFDKKVNPVPVVDDDGRLIGIISRSDLVRLMIREGQETSKT